MKIKCANCGLVNFSHDSFCKRCKSPVEQALEYHNVWRDGKRLVVSTAEHLMPKRCLKCGTTDNVGTHLLELTYTPISSYFTILMKFTSWTEVTLHGFLCTSHRRFAERQTFLLLPNILVVAGACSVLLSLSGDDPGLRMMLFFGGALMAGLGIFFKKAASGTLKVVKHNRKHIWIKGVDQNLLAQLEDFAVAKR